MYKQYKNAVSPAVFDFMFCQELYITSYVARLLTNYFLWEAGLTYFSVCVSHFCLIFRLLDITG